MSKKELYCVFVKSFLDINYHIQDVKSAHLIAICTNLKSARTIASEWSESYIEQWNRDNFSAIFEHKKEIPNRED